jgi:hypothetical protein
MPVTLNQIKQRSVLSVSDDYADTKENILNGLFGKHNRNGKPYSGGRGPQKSSLDIQNGKIVIFINAPKKDRNGAYKGKGPWLNVPKGFAADEWKRFEQQLQNPTAIANLSGDVDCAVFVKQYDETVFRFKGIYQRKRATPQSPWVYSRTADTLTLNDWKQA